MRSAFASSSETLHNVRNCNSVNSVETAAAEEEDVFPPSHTKTITHPPTELKQITIVYTGKVKGWPIREKGFGFKNGTIISILKPFPADFASLRSNI